MLEVKGGFFRNLFGGKSRQEKEDLRSKELVKNQQNKPQEAKPVDRSEKKPFWKSMKEAFKKKNQ